MKLWEFSVGEVFKTESYIITQEEIVEFATRFDPHYFHLDEEKAKDTHFKGIIASGLHTLSLSWSLWIKMGILSEDLICGVGMDRIRFLKPVYPGDSLTSEVTILSIESHPRKKNMGYIEFQLSVRNQDSALVLEAELKALMKGERKCEEQ